MEQSGRALRLAAATVRRHLLSLAARALDVDISSLEVDDGLVQSRETTRTVTYWELFGDKAFGIPVDPDARVTAPDDFRSDARRGGKECVSQGRFRRAPEN